MVVNANDFNGVASYYNSALGVSFALVSHGQLVRASSWANMIPVIFSVAAFQGKTILGTMPDPNLFLVGARIVNRTFPLLDAGPAPATLTYTSSGTFVIPAGIYSMTVIAACAGGGGGGGGQDQGNGSGGGGGGSGGYITGYFYAMTPGQTVTVQIGDGGAGGSGFNGGSPGGNTAVYIDGTQVINIGSGGGGAGGATSGNNAGGIGGSPGGQEGQIGLGGGGDSASGAGGVGGANPFGTGGAAGTYLGITDGGAGIGYGAGGGGAGFIDRTAPFRWVGGNGSGGYCQISYP